MQEAQLRQLDLKARAEAAEKELDSLEAGELHAEIGALQETIVELETRAEAAEKRAEEAIQRGKESEHAAKRLERTLERIRAEFPDSWLQRQCDAALSQPQEPHSCFDCGHPVSQHSGQREATGCEICDCKRWFVVTPAQPQEREGERSSVKKSVRGAWPIGHRQERGR
jgi:hypothetical protein